MPYVSKLTPEQRRINRAATRHKYYIAHKPEYIRDSKNWRTKNPKKYKLSMRKHDLKRHYGLTPEQYNEMFRAQGYCCAVCGSTDPGRKSGEWAIDHDHTTGKVRGILCHGCNIALGHIKDDPKRLRALADYLERS